MTRIPLLALLLALLAAPAAGASSLVEVPIDGPRSVRVLERLGLDVTHDVRDDRARVVLHGARDARTLRRHFPFRTLVADVEATLARSAARARRRARTAQASGLPSRRSYYRVLANYYAEIDALAEAHPGLVRKVTIGTSVEGRDIVGMEIAKNVNRSDDGRPLAAFFGLHHAREWPSGEVNMEFALDLARTYGKDARVTALLDRVRVFVVPVVNPDGFVVSRGTVEAAGGGNDPLHRRNCRPNTPQEASLPCTARGTQDGVDLNRNYGSGWGGPGADTSRTSDSYRGPGPFSEPESQAVHEFSRRHQVMHVQSTHNIVGWVLRQPGFKDNGLLSPDERIMKPLGDRMGEATGYESLLGYDLYDVHGATEDWNYIEQGAMGYTIELGPSDTQEGGGDAPLFFGPYQTHVVDQYLGGPTGGPAGKGIREAFLLAAEQAGNAADHGVLEGLARPGHTLRVRKDFTTDTARRCPDAGVCTDANRLAPLQVPDFIDTTLSVPASGRFEWHVGPSTRPYVAAAGRVERWTMTCEAPSGAVVARRDVEVRRGDRIAFTDACDSSAPVDVHQGGDTPPPDTDPVVRPPRTMRLFVGPRRVPRFALRRRGYLRVAMKVSGATVRNLRVRLFDGDRDLLAARSFRRLEGRKAIRLRLRGVPPRGVYRLSLRGVADNGAAVGSAVRLRVVGR